MSIHCCVCVNLNTSSSGPPPLTDGEINWVKWSKWNYICCPPHASLVREHGIGQALKLLTHTNPSARAT